MAKKVTAFFLCAVLLMALAGCGSARPPESEDGAGLSGEVTGNVVNPDREEADPAAADTDPSDAATGEGYATEDTYSTWRDAYCDLLKQLIVEEDLYMQADESLPITGVKYAQLADFNFDGTPELVVLYNRTVALYTYRTTGRCLELWKGDVGARYGQTDVSYTFAMNTLDEPCIGLYHSENEWTQEDITLVRYTGGTGVSLTELSAATDGNNSEPTREQLISFRIDGQEVAQAEYYNTLGTIASAQEIDVDWGGLPGTVTWLTALRAYLSGSDEFLCPTSGFERLTREDLEGLDAAQLRVARNEIYARHGLDFQSEDLRAIFGACSWYTPVDTWPAFEAADGNVLNAYEVANVELIKTLEGAANASMEQQGEEPASEETAETDPPGELTYPLTAEGARQRAMTYWGVTEGETDSESGFRLEVFADEEPIEGEDGVYYAVWLRWLVEGDHWSSLDRIYVNVDNGECVYELDTEE